jgi:hypothetical protein
LKKDVTDMELASHIEPRLRDLPYRPRIAKEPPVSAWSTEDRVPSTDAGERGESVADTAEPVVEPSSGTETKSSEASPAAAAAHSAPVPPLDPKSREYPYLIDVKNRPFVCITERNESLRLTNYMGNRIVRKLVGMGLVEELDIPCGRKGRAKKFLVLTDKGKNLVGSQHLGPGKGGFEHVYHQQRLQAHFAAQGYTATIEQFQNGKAVDLGLVRDGHRVAIEVAMSPQGEADNFEKDLRAGWPEVWSLARTENVREQAQREWEERKAAFPEGSVKFLLLTDSLNDSRGDS